MFRVQVSLFLKYSFLMLLASVKEMVVYIKTLGNDRCSRKRTVSSSSRHHSPIATELAICEPQTRSSAKRWVSQEITFLCKFISTVMLCYAFFCMLYLSVLLSCKFRATEARSCVITDDCTASFSPSTNWGNGYFELCVCVIALDSRSFSFDDKRRNEGDIENLISGSISYDTELLSCCSFGIATCLSLH